MEHELPNPQRIALQLALNHMRYALGVLDRSEEHPEIAAQLDLAVSRLAEDLKMREVEDDQRTRGLIRPGHLRMVKA